MVKFTRKHHLNNGFHRFRLNHYTKKLYMAPFMKLLLFAQLHGTESFRALADAVLSDDLQKQLDSNPLAFRNQSEG